MPSLLRIGNTCGNETVLPVLTPFRRRCSRSLAHRRRLLPGGLPEAKSACRATPMRKSGTYKGNVEDSSSYLERRVGPVKGFLTALAPASRDILEPAYWEGSVTTPILRCPKANLHYLVNDLAMSHAFQLLFCAFLFLCFAKALWSKLNHECGLSGFCILLFSFICN